jgi:hypothetical protein
MRHCPRTNPLNYRSSQTPQDKKVTDCLESSINVRLWSVASRRGGDQRSGADVSLMMVVWGHALGPALALKSYAKQMRNGKTMADAQRILDRAIRWPVDERDCNTTWRWGRTRL